MRILTIVLISAFVLSIAPAAVFAGCGGAHAYQSQLVQSQPVEKISKDKEQHETMKTIVAQKKAPAKASTDKKE
ncbi:MAG: hypothetical protein D6736_15880 [Nitrospinota bacterium]|nr:MAG: hypothetical protein D6736_15880 [Nitrospinota bacterium]